MAVLAAAPAVLAQALPGDPMTMPSPLLKQAAPGMAADGLTMRDSGAAAVGGSTPKAGIAAYRDLADKLQRMGYGKAEAGKLASYCVGHDLTLLSSCVEAGRNGLAGKL
ncbi:MAG: hypothetical protein U1E14_14630 [Geminicoccaceae bacterium]